MSAQVVAGSHHANGHAVTSRALQGAPDVRNAPRHFNRSRNGRIYAPRIRQPQVRGLFEDLSNRIAQALAFPRRNFRIHRQVEQLSVNLPRLYRLAILVPDRRLDDRKR